MTKRLAAVLPRLKVDAMRQPTPTARFGLVVFAIVLLIGGASIALHA